MIGRRDFLGLGALAVQAPKEAKKVEEWITASATFDRTPKVGIVLSSFAGSTEHDGTPLKGLAKPRPADAQLSDDEINAMVRKAIELGNTRRGGLATIVAPDDWVVIKTNIAACYGLGPADGPSHNPYVPGSVSDLRVVKSVISFLVEHKRGSRITVAEGSAEWQPKERSKLSTDGWTTDWGGAYGGLSYRSMIEDFSRRHPSVEFDLVDLNFDEYFEAPAPGRAQAANNRQGIYAISKTIRSCDKLISIAPLKTDRACGVSLSAGNYLGIAPGACYGFPKKALDALGAPDDLVIDLFLHHPADYAVLGGSWGIEGEGPSAPGGESVHHNVVIAGPNATAVDTVASAVMGFDAKTLPYLDKLNRRGFGVTDIDSIWTRGNEVEQARRVFRKPSRWEKSR
jgi:uncharacterized protein (DUF362 family)